MKGLEGAGVVLAIPRRHRLELDGPLEVSQHRRRYGDVPFHWIPDGLVDGMLKGEQSGELGVSVKESPADFV